MLLADKVAVISGGASPRGIGLATGRLLAQHGARVAILDLDQTASEAAAASLGKGHRGFACDVTSLESCHQAVAQVLAAFGQADILVNNAGITQPLKFLEIKPENYDAVMDVNLRGILYLSQAFIRFCHPSCRRAI